MVMIVLALTAMSVSGCGAGGAASSEETVEVESKDNTATQEQDKETAAESTIKKAKELIAQKDYEGAISILEEVQDDGTVKEMLTQTEYDYANLLYEQGSYSDAEFYFDDLEDYENSELMLGKCLLANKYANFDYEHVDLGGGDVDGMTEEDIRNSLESSLQYIFYRTWYKASDGTEEQSELKIDSVWLDGKRYGIDDYEVLGGAGATNITVHYLEDPENTFTISAIPSMEFVDVGPIVQYLSFNSKEYCELRWFEVEELGHLQQEAMEAKQSTVTKETVYAYAQQDTKSLVFKRFDIFDQILIAATVTWSFDSVDNIQYEYDPDTRSHSMVFNVKYSEYQGVGDQLTVKIAAQYREDDYGTLSKVQFQPVSMQ